MKVVVRITQKTLYTDYHGKPDEYADTLHFEFDNLNAAKDLVDAFPESEIADINVVMTVTLKDHDKREPAEDGEGE